MKTILYVTSILIIVTCISAINQPKLIAEHAEIELLSDKFAFTEGPASDTSGNVYFTDIPNNTIYLYTTDSELKVFKKNSPANGLAFDNNEMLIVCGSDGGRNLYEIDVTTGQTQEIVSSVNGKKFNSPNDLWIDKNNGIYFTDPRYGNRGNMELETEQVYYIKPDRSGVIRVTENLEKPNGILGIENGKKLLITDHEAGTVFIYNIKKDGTLTGKKKFIENENVDGMAVDEMGNIYITSNNVKIYSSKGFLIDEIKTPETPTNVCFGGSDFKTLFITERKNVYKIKMNVKGSRY